MANPSDKGGRGPAGPVAEPLKTETSSTSAASPSAAPSAGVASAGAPSAPSGSTSGQFSQATQAGRSSRASQTGASLRDELKDTAQTAAEAVRQQAAQFAEDVGHELGKTGEAQKARGVDAIRSFARAIDSAAAELEGQSPTVAHTVHEAARRVDGLSDNLSNRNVNELIDSAAQLARTQPALFIGGSVAAGFALARFLKSSARHRPSAGYDPYQR
jgi:hypothetical protein